MNYYDSSKHLKLVSSPESHRIPAYPQNLPVFQHIPRISKFCPIKFCFNSLHFPGPKMTSPNPNSLNPNGLHSSTVNFKSIVILQTATTKEIRLAEAHGIETNRNLFTIDRNEKHLYVYQGNKIEIYSIYPRKKIKEVEFKGVPLDIKAGKSRLIILEPKLVYLCSLNRFETISGEFLNSKILLMGAANEQNACQVNNEPNACHPNNEPNACQVNNEDGTSGNSQFNSNSQLSSNSQFSSDSHFSSDSQFNSNSNESPLFGIQSNKQLTVYSRDHRVIKDYRCQCSFYHDRILLLGDFNILRVIIKGEERMEISLPEMVTTICSDKLFTKIYCGLINGQILVISMTGKERKILEYHKKPVNNIRLNLMGNVMYSTDEEIVCSWDTRTGVVTSFVCFEEKVKNLEICVFGDRNCQSSELLM